LEVILRRLANDAMRSEPRALKLLLALYDRYEVSPETDVRLNEILAEDREILSNFLDKTADPKEAKNKSGKRRSGYEH
jgi:hypothetical protein